MKAFIFLLLVAVSSASNTSNTLIEQDDFPDRIITNGFTATEGSAPYTVFLLFPNSGWCGGSIIGHTWVVTASHCTLPHNSVTIHYGSLRRAQGQIVHTVEGNNIINHPRDDIALLRTPHVNFSSTINRVLLPQMRDRNNQYVNQWALACGWGQTTTTNSPEMQQCVRLQVISVSQCRQTYNNNYANSRTLCVATPGGRSICYGDSGGPLVRNNRLIGVSMFVSTKGCTSGEPSGFARVTSHLNWIRQHTGISY